MPRIRVPERVTGITVKLLRLLEANLSPRSRCEEIGRLRDQRQLPVTGAVDFVDH